MRAVKEPRSNVMDGSHKKSGGLRVAPGCVCSDTNLPNEYDDSIAEVQVETLAVLSTPASQVILAYRLRTTRATAAHFFHLLGMWFEEPQPVRYELLHRTYTAADVTLYQLRRRPARLLPAPCAYCAMLLRTVGAPSG